MMLTAKPNTCPDVEVLGEFLLGKQGAADSEEIARHLEDCATCSEKARLLESQTDSLVDTLRLTMKDDTTDPKEPACLAGAQAVAGNNFSVAQLPSNDLDSNNPIASLGTYKLLEEIGRGGTGIVYRAEHTRLKTIVAVKVLPAEALTQPDILARFDREMAAIGQLVHSHIVHATDADVDKGRHFLVMEYIAGGDLATLVDRQGPLPVAEAITCVLQAARGLAYAHAKGMIHRDVKPSNLLLGIDGTVKVSDLGLARVLLGAEGDGSTHTGSLMGTFDYMAPEQALNAKAADERADIYGLGCTLYFFLTGTPPYQSDSAFETLIAHREWPSPAVGKIRTEVPRSLDRLLQRMLSKEPRNRPQSMEQLARELESIRTKTFADKGKDLTYLLSDERREIDLKPRKKSKRWLRRRNPASIWIAACLGAILGSLLVGTVWMWWSGPGLPFLPPRTSVARFEVRLVRAAEGVSVGHVPDAISLLNGELPNQAIVSGRYRFIDFIDPISNSGGFFDADLAFPGFQVSTDFDNSNHFALKAVATVSFPRSGVWTFCVVSDDGFQLSLDGKVVGSHISPRTQAASLMPVNIEKSGPHVVELIYFEGTGGADLEFCVAEGRYDDFDAEAFQLVGASYDGGLPLVRPE